MSLKTVVRAGNWWASKIPPLLAIGYAEILFHRTPLGLSLALLGAVAWSICSVASYGHVINDIFDIEQDRQAGKRNFMEPFTPWQQAGFALLTFAAGFLPLLWASYGLAASIALLVNFGLPTIYSIPPLRFKERGLLGVLCDTSGAHLVPTIFIALVYTNNAPNPSAEASWFLYLAAPWAFVFGLKGILNHQLADRASDLIAGAETFGTQSDPTRTLRFVSRVLYWIEVAALLGVVVTLWPVAPLVAACLPIYCGIEILKGWVGWTFAFDQAGEVRGRNVPFANNRFYELWMPVALATELVFQQGSFVGVLLAHLWLFRGNLLEQVREFSPLIKAIKHALKNRQYESRWGLRLELLGSSQAELVPTASDQVAKAVIHRAPGERWDVKVFSRQFEITKGNSYRIRAKVRAIAPRKISFGICQGSEPWDGLGVNEEVELSTSWRTFFADFTASTKENDARVYLWLGGDTKAVEIEDMSLAPVAQEHVWTLDRASGCDAVLLALEESAQGCRAEILTTIGRSSDVKISVGRWPLHENCTYELRFVARADTPRYIGIAVAERDPPWSDVGISEPLEIDGDWREYRFPLTARRSGNAAAAFFLGERTGGVDVSDVAIKTISPRPTWRLECQSPARAVRASLAGDGTGIRVVPREVDDKAGSIKLHARPLQLTKDGTYRVRLNVRADEARQVLIEVAQDSAPWGGLGLSTTVAVGPRWEPWTQYFLATDDESLGTLQMGLGDSMVPVEVQSADLESCPREAAWFLDVGGASQARWLPLDDSPGGVRVRLNAVDGVSSSVKLSSGLHDLADNQTYVVRFTARGESARWLAIGVGLFEEPWTNLGLEDEIEIGDDWRAFELPFLALASSSRATVYFFLGESEADVEIRNVELIPLPQVPPPWIIRQQASCRATRRIVDPEKVVCEARIVRRHGTYSSIKLARSFGAVSAGRAYRASLRGRAEKPRPARVEILIETAEGPTVGFSEPVLWVPDTATYAFDFVAPASCARVWLEVGLGESDIGVEVSDASLVEIETGELWRLDRTDGCRAQVTQLNDRKGARRVQVIETIGSESNVKLSVGRQAFSQGRPCRVRFFARANGVRWIRFGVSQREEPWRPLGLETEIEVTTEWREYVEDFVPSQDESDATIHFWLGKETGFFDLVDVSASPSPIAFPWRLERQPGSHAHLAQPSAPGDAVAVNLAGSDGNAASVKLSWKSFPVFRGKAGQVRFRARADFPRRLTVTLAQDHEPWSNLGLNEECPLTAEWRQYSLDVTPVADDPSARLYFGLGESVPGVSLADLEWRPLEQSHQWLLIRHETVAATRLPMENPDSGVRVEMDRTAGDPWHVKLCRGPFQVEGGGAYRIRFRARGEAPRTILAGLSQFQSPWGSLAANVGLELSTEWQTFVIELMTSKSDLPACVHFCLGESPVSVEVAEVTLVRLPSDQIWSLEADSRCAAQLVELEDSSEGRRVVILRGDGDPWHLKLVRGPMAVTANQHYRMTFSARAPFPRRLRFGLGQSQAPWKILTSEEDVDLTPQWRMFVHDFRLKEDESRARFWFCLGESNVPVDFRDLKLETCPEEDFFTLQRNGDCRAERLALEGEAEGVRIVLPRVSGEGWQVKLSRPPQGIRAGLWYRFHFAARADRARPLAFGVAQANSPWKNLGLSASSLVTEDWQWFFRDFVATGDEEQALEYFWLGQHAAAVEIKEVVREPCPSSGPWSLWCGAGADAQTYLVEGEGTQACRVVLTQLDGTAWKVKLNCSLFSLAAGRDYRLSFRCRSDAERAFSFGVGRATPSGESLGLFRNAAVGKDWQEMTAEFKGTQDATSASVFFWLGKHASPFEVAEVRCEPNG